MKSNQSQGAAVTSVKSPMKNGHVSLLQKVTNHFKEVGSKVWKDWDLYLLLIPGLVWFVTFLYRPMLGLRMAFYDYNVYKGFDGSEWIGLQNFIEFVSGPEFVRVVGNTFMLSFYQLFICFPVPVLLAILISEIRSKPLRTFTQTVTFLPHLISVVVVCGIVLSFLSPSSGVINQMIQKLGFEPIYFMVKPEYFRGIYTGMTLWQSAGFNAIVYIAALAGIDPEIYEAATMDGAGKLKKIRYITLPSIMPTIVTMLVLNIGKMVKVGYESILLLYQPSTYETADVIATYAYRLGLEQNNYGLSTAVSLFEALITLIMVVGANKLSKKVTDSTVW